MHKAPGKSHREGIRLMQLTAMFPDEDAARAWFEEQVWPDGSRTCPRCRGSKTKPTPNGKPLPYWCSSCRRHFPGADPDRHRTLARHVAAVGVRHLPGPGEPQQSVVKVPWYEGKSAAGSCGRSARSEEDGDPGDLLLAKEKRTTKPASANVRRPKGYAPLSLGCAESEAPRSWNGQALRHRRRGA